MQVWLTRKEGRIDTECQEIWSPKGHAQGSHHCARGISEAALACRKVIEKDEYGAVTLSGWMKVNSVRISSDLYLVSVLWVFQAFAKEPQLYSLMSLQARPWMARVLTLL